MEGSMEWWMDRQTDRRTNIQIHTEVKHSDKQTNIKTDKKRKGETNTQKENHIKERRSVRQKVFQGHWLLRLWNGWEKEKRKKKKEKRKEEKYVQRSAMTLTAVILK